MGERKPQVNVAVDGDQKERWENAVEQDPRFSTMSDLIRMSVEREIATGGDRGNQSGGKEVAKFSQRVESLENTIHGLSNDFQELKGIIQNQKPNRNHLKSEVFAALPEGESASPMSAEEIAGAVGGPIDTETAQEVLDDLARTGNVESHIGTEEGDIRYRKKGDN